MTCSKKTNFAPQILIMLAMTLVTTSLLLAGCSSAPTKLAQSDVPAEKVTTTTDAEFDTAIENVLVNRTLAEFEAFAGALLIPLVKTLALEDATKLCALYNESARALSISAAIHLDGIQNAAGLEAAIKRFGITAEEEAQIFKKTLASAEFDTIFIRTSLLNRQDFKHLEAKASDTIHKYASHTKFIQGPTGEVLTVTDEVRDALKAVRRMEFVEGTKEELAPLGADLADVIKEEFKAGVPLTITERTCRPGDVAVGSNKKFHVFLDKIAGGNMGKIQKAFKKAAQYVQGFKNKAQKLACWAIKGGQAMAQGTADALSIALADAAARDMQLVPVCNQGDESLMPTLKTISEGKTVDESACRL